MASRQQILIALLLVLGFYFYSLGEAKVEKKTVATARKEDVPFIKCSVCEAMAKQLVRQVKEKREKSAPKKLTELQIIDVAENICNMKKEESDWILKLDIVEKGDKLQLVEQPVEGVCKTECKTIERTCQEVMGDHDTDVAEYLYKKGATRAGVTTLLCKELSKACVGKPPRLPKNREPGEPFMPKTSKDAEMEKLMRSMSDMPGAPGMKMYSREDLMRDPRLMDGSSNVDEDEDEDEDDEESTLEENRFVKQSAEKGAVKNVWQDSVGKLGNQFGAQTQKAWNIALQQVEKAAKGFRTWWSGEKLPSKPSEATSKSKSSSDWGEL